MQFKNYQTYLITKLQFVLHFNALSRLFSERIILFFLMFLMLIFTISSNYTIAQNDTFIVVLDAGHGAEDPGALGKNAKEKDIALAITLKVGKYIEENLKNVKVIYTRTKDVYPKLHERSKLANENNANLFISIHVNASTKKSVTGTSTFVMGLHKNTANLNVAKTENAYVKHEDNYKSNYAGFDPDSPESYIRMSLEQNIYIDLSLSLAAKIQDQFENRAGRNSRGVKQAGFLVLWRTTMPSVLIETGFITNLTEEKYLTSEYGQDIIASAIYRAFRDYKNEIEEQTIKPLTADNDTVTMLANDPPIFKIQVAASKNKINLNTKKFRKYNSIEEHFDGTYYKYTIGSENCYDKIVTLHKKIKRKFKDSFIVAYKNDKKISVKEAKAEISN